MTDHGKTAYDAHHAAMHEQTGRRQSHHKSYDQLTPKVRARYEAAGRAVAGPLEAENARLREQLAALAAEKPRWTERFGPVVACEHDLQSLAAARSDVAFIWRETTDPQARERADRALTALTRAGVECDPAKTEETSNEGEAR